jgi:Fe2+ transport system protein FeoA
MMELGFVPGTLFEIITIVFGMVVISIRHSIIAIRKSDFAKIQYEN